MFMDEDRDTLEQYAPGLDKHLADLGLEAIETAEPRYVAGLIRQYNLPGLWVLAELGGKGINAYDGIRVQRAIGSRSPSMALMLTMHNFTVSFCNGLAAVVPACADLLRHTAEYNLLVASAFAEGRYGAGILDSTVYITRDDDGVYRINGSKKPCSMTHCADIITIGIAEKNPDGSKRTGMAILPADLPGITRHRFWNTPVLAAADSHELRFTDARVTEEQLLLAGEDDAETAQIVAGSEITGLCWFEIVATASYLGMVSLLAEKALRNTRVDAGERAQLGGELECARAALDGAVRIMETAVVEPALLAKILAVRFGVQHQIERNAMLAAELAGGLNFVCDSDTMLLLCASRCLAFHPISRKAAEPMLADWLSGAADRG